jgi:hypothetical protein
MGSRGGDLLASGTMPTRRLGAPAACATRATTSVTVALPLSRQGHRGNHPASGMTVSGRPDTLA